MKGKSNQESLPSRIEGLARIDAWHRLVAAEGRAASEATVARLLDGTCARFVVLPAGTLASVPGTHYRLSGEVRTLPPKPGWHPCDINEVYPGLNPGGWRSLPCVVLKDWTAEEIAPLMADRGLGLVLVADDAGLGLIHQDGRLEPLAGSVDKVGVLAAWQEWSRRRYPDGPSLHLLAFPVGSWGSNYVQRMAEDRRLKATYGGEAIEAARQRIMAGESPAAVVLTMLPSQSLT